MIRNTVLPMRTAHGIFCVFPILHIEDKPRAVNRIAKILNDTGRFVLSIDKDPSKFIDVGIRKIRIYLDKADEMAGYIKTAGLTILKQYDIEFATIFVAEKG